jgi:hypothetical protein
MNQTSSFRKRDLLGGAAGVILVLGFLPHWTFQHAAMFWSGAIILLIFALISRSKAGRIVCVVLALACSAAAAREYADAYPLWVRVAGGQFRAVPLSSLLIQLAKQRQQRPYWTFIVCDKQLAGSTISVDIPDRCTLQEALEVVSRSLHCQWNWQWHGGEPTPLCVIFSIGRLGEKAPSWGDQGYLVVDRKGILFP